MFVLEQDSSESKPGETLSMRLDHTSCCSGKTVCDRVRCQIFGFVKDFATRIELTMAKVMEFRRWWQKCTEGDGDRMYKSEEKKRTMRITYTSQG